MNTHSASAGGVVYIGVDVCAEWLDIHGLKSKKITRLANTATGHAKLIAQLPDVAHVVLEATGGYEQALWLALLRAGRIVSRVNPGRVRHFAKASMKLAKTETSAPMRWVASRSSSTAIIVSRVVSNWRTTSLTRAK